MPNRGYIASKAVEKFCKHETEDYSYFSPIEIGEVEESDNYVYVDVEFPENSVRFRVSGGQLDVKDPDLDILKLEVELGEGSFEEVTTFSWRVKYFWMALLKW